jgi:hypothetical protein
MLKFHLFLSFMLFQNLGFSQTCDCDIFPIKSECKDSCKIKMLQNGTKQQLKKDLKLSEETAKKIINVPKRKNKTKIEDFQDVLPCKYYNEFESKLNSHYAISFSQSIVNGDAFTGDKIMGNKTVNNNTNNFFQSEYKPLNKTIEDEVAKNLALLVKKYPAHPLIQIDIEAGNNQRRKIALSLSRLLGDKNLGYYPERRVTMGNYPDYPITVRTKPENEIFISEFMKALRPFIIGEYAIFKDPNMGSGGMPDVIFYLNGMPIFDANGVVKIE